MPVVESRKWVCILAHRGNRRCRNVQAEHIDAANLDARIRVEEILNPRVAQRIIAVPKPDREHLAALQQVEARGAHDRLQPW